MVNTLSKVFLSGVYHLLNTLQCIFSSSGYITKKKNPKNQPNKNPMELIYL